MARITHKSHTRWRKRSPISLFQLSTRSLQIPMTPDTEAVENHPGSVRPIERVEMNTGNIISHKIMALFQRVLNARAPDHLGVILTRLQST